MDDNDNLFSHPGLSSPVILVFMAIGVCCAAGMTFFAWRRFLLAQNPTALGSPTYRREDNQDSMNVDAGRKPVVFDLWTRSVDNSTHLHSWGQMSPLSLTFSMTKRMEEIHLTKQLSSLPSRNQSLTNIPPDPTRDVRGTAQVALSIVFPDEHRKGPSLGQYAIGVTVVNVTASAKKS